MRLTRHQCERRRWQRGGLLTEPAPVLMTVVRDLRQQTGTQQHSDEEPGDEHLLALTVRIGDRTQPTPEAEPGQEQAHFLGVLDPKQSPQLRDVGRLHRNDTECAQEGDAELHSVMVADLGHVRKSSFPQ